MVAELHPGRDLRVLVLSNMYPGPGAPEWGIFVAEQVRSLREWINVRVVAKRSRSAIAYLPFFLRSATAGLTSGWDLIHAHYGFHSALIPVCLGRHPLVVTFHGSDALIEPRRRRLYARLQRQVVREADCLIAVSEEVRARLIEELGADPAKLVHLPCGTDTVHFRPEEQGAARARLGMAANEKVVLFVGRLSHAKGVDLLRAAAEELRAVRFHFLGGGDLRWEAENCRFLGPRPHREIVDWLNAADLLVLPSLSEGTPVTVLEALATETPVVCSRVGACPDLVVEGKTGLLVEPGDAAGLVRALRAGLFETRFEPAPGRELIKREYDLGVTARRLVAIYREVVRG